MVDIELGKRVVSRDGEHIGDVDRIVIDPTTEEIVQLIVKQGVILTTDRIVERGAITRIDADGTLHIDIPAALVDAKLPEFVRTRYVTPNKDQLSTSMQAWVAAPSLGESVLWAPGDMGQGYDPHSGIFEAAPLSPPVEEVRQNIDENLVVIDSGTDVVDKTGHKIGTVDRAVYDADGELTEFIVKEGVLFHHDVRVPADWVEAITPDSVQLQVTADEAEQAEPSGA